jgi:sialidase-1
MEKMTEPIFEKHTVFKSKTKGVHCYRIPALILSSKGTLIAFNEGRQRSCSDWAHCAIIGRRCLDPIKKLDQWEDQFVVKESDRLVEPKSWSEIMEAGNLADEMGLDQDADDFEPKIDVVTNNPVPIVDMDGKTIHLIYCEHYDSVFYTKSTDDGETWAESVNITKVIEEIRPKRDWTTIASGPGHGIQLKWGEHKGRLIVPFWITSNKEDPTSHKPSEVMTIYSDDNGKSWIPGDFVPFTMKNPNETQAIQLTNGEIMINSRSAEPRSPTNTKKQRLISHSSDGAHNWNEYAYDEYLPEPMVMGSLIRYKSIQEHGQSQLLFSLPNPDISKVEFNKRENLTIWLSEDEGKSWPISRCLDSGPSAYSDIAVDPENGIAYCLYEGGLSGDKLGAYSGQTIVKFNIVWLKGN